MSSKDGSQVPSVAPQNGSPNKRKSENPIPETDATKNAPPTSTHEHTNADDEHIFGFQITIY